MRHPLVPNFSANGWPVDVEENESEFDLDQSADLIIGDYVSLSIAKLRFRGHKKDRLGRAKSGVLRID